VSFIEWTVDDNIAVITMNHGENRFNVPFLRELQVVLDDIEKKTEANSLIITSGDQKIWCNGMDTEWLVPAVRRNDPEVDTFLDLQDDILERVLSYPMITIAAINGHAFAIGAIFSCAFDFRFMRTDRGFLCFPEADMNIPIAPFAGALIKKAFPRYMLEEAVFTGKRFTAKELEEGHVIRKGCSNDELMMEARAFAKSLNKGRWIVSELKQVLYHDIRLTRQHNSKRVQLRTDIPIK
jgi:Delta3-Delta2-enoyl-CoA isomerase